MTLTPPSLPGGECYPRAHGAAARVRPAALGVYSLRKSGASDIGYPFPRHITLRPSSKVAGAIFGWGSPHRQTGDGQTLAHHPQPL